MTVRPSRFSTMPRYCSSNSISSLATPTQPGMVSTCRSCGLSVLPLMVVIGRKVARPSLFWRRYAIMSLAMYSSVVTTFCSAPPSTASVARSSRLGTRISVATTPRTPAFPRACSRTCLTAC